MPRFANQFTAALAAIMIMAGSFGAILTVPAPSADAAVAAIATPAVA
ncbi:hypothetical protein [Parerythrobacter jejuensis]|uniref:Uncharacterized protein n=1 Tax=Parerythrobacter jejuensis TaxID=795812 RepID=A0A845AVA5_9SPHN|nr:hypothetical protein [Parerythrobacter jejuensis]MXP30679.1 hypothetical protein [Parerythrobacter jejuensis]MXP33439.1 hypothetical protein [Parerythrobacter jejuensis]